MATGCRRRDVPAGRRPLTINLAFAHDPAGYLPLGFLWPVNAGHGNPLPVQEAFETLGDLLCANVNFPTALRISAKRIGTSCRRIAV